MYDAPTHRYHHSLTRTHLHSTPLLPNMHPSTISPPHCVGDLPTCPPPSVTSQPPSTTSPSAPNHIPHPHRFTPRTKPGARVAPGDPRCGSLTTPPGLGMFGNSLGCRVGASRHRSVMPFRGVCGPYMKRRKPQANSYHTSENHLLFSG